MLSSIETPYLNQSFKDLSNYVIFFCDKAKHIWFSMLCYPEQGHNNLTNVLKKIIMRLMQELNWILMKTILQVLS